MRRGLIRWALIAATISMVGCEGTMSFLGDSAQGGDQLVEYTPDGRVKDPDVLPDRPVVPDGCTEQWCMPERPVYTPRLLRMTHLQWENSVRDILALPARTGLSSTFKADTLPPGHFDRDARTLEVDSVLWDDYRKAAEELAAEVTGDPAKLAAITPAGASGEPRAVARAILESVGRKTYRRPLSAEEIARHMQVYDDAPMHVDAGADAFVAGVDMMLRALLQSPYFIYRLELTPSPDGATRLTGYEVAAKLALALWNSAPDDALLDAAAAGSLASAEGVREQAERMMADPKATEMILDHYDQMLHFDEYVTMMKVDPAFDAQMGESMKAEMELFFEYVILTKSGTLEELLTTPETFVNQHVASIYGLEGITGDEFQLVTLDESQRPGMLTRAGFMAHEAGADQTAPIMRGLFVNEHITCSSLPPAPNEINGDPFVGNTNRERWEAMTDRCGSACHAAYLNPPGFAFENYDFMGRWQETDGGFPVDASGVYQWDGNEVAFDDAPSMIRTLAAREDVHHCYADHWFEYLYGRKPEAAEAPLIARMAHESYTKTESIKATIVGLVTSDAFMYRVPNE